MEQNKNNSIVNELRELWRKGEWKEFNRIYSLGKWMIPKEEQEKIDAALIQKGWLKNVSKLTGEQQSLIDYAMEIMPGSKIVNN